MRDNLLYPKKLTFQQSIEGLSLIPIMIWVHAPFVVTLMKVQLLIELILEFKGRVQHNQGILPC